MTTSTPAPCNLRASVEVFDTICQRLDYSASVIVRKGKTALEAGWEFLGWVGVTPRDYHRVTITITGNA